MRDTLSGKMGATWPWGLQIGGYRSVSAATWLLGALLLLLALLAYFVHAGYRQTVDSTAVTTRNLVQVIESSLSDDFSRIDGILRLVEAGLAEGGGDVSSRGSSWVDLLALKRSFSKVVALGVYDAEGRLGHSSSPSATEPDIGHKAYFLDVRRQVDAEQVFSPVRIDEVSGQRSILQGRVLRDAEGRFVGLVAAVFDLDEVADLFRRIEVGAGGLALLRRSDDSTLIQRFPPLNVEDFNRPLPVSNPIRQRIDAGERAGTLTYVATTDGEARIGSFKVLDDFPFYAQVALAERYYLADWRNGLWRMVLVAALLVLGFGFAILRLRQDDRQLERIAHFDALTGLPNRVLLSDRLMQAMYRSRRNESIIAVAYLDLDGFKEVNDSHGHVIGDRLLVALAARMKECARDGDTVARLGGDEFVVVFCDLDDIAACTGLLGRLISAIDQEVIIDGLDLHVSCSVGVTFYPQREVVEAEQLLRQADQAMYQAKLGGKNGFHLFDVEHDQLLRGQHEQLEGIRQALERGEFVLHYQPKVNMRSGEVVGAEALIRWNHPQQGLLSPAAFLPAIEQHRLDIDLGVWVLESALAQAQAWEADGVALPVSVNVSAHFLQHAEFLPMLEAALRKCAALPAGRLELEVLESSALTDIERASEVIETCSRLGVGIALDDFGTGYSSLSYLKRLPVRQLKIDRSFVHDMLHDPDDLAILEGVLGLARAFRREVIAEGVETLEHGRALLQLGCELGQGFGIARPMLAAELLVWIARWRPDPLWAATTALSEDNIALLHAGVELEAWMREVSARIEQGQPLPDGAGIASCRCSAWLSRWHPPAGREASFQDVRTKHARLHELVREVFKRRSLGDQRDVAPALAEAQRLCADLRGSMQALLVRGHAGR